MVVLTITFRITDKDGRNYGECSEIEEARNIAQKMAQRKFGEEIIIEKLTIKTLERYCYE